MKLRPMEQALLDRLKKMKSPIKLSAKEIGKDINLSVIYPEISRQQINRYLLRLQKKGCIRYDTTNHAKPVIYVN